MDLTPLIEAEWHNHKAMLREALVKNRDYPAPPTYGSALDSWLQMPEDIQQEYFPGVDPELVTQALVANDLEEGLPS